MNFKEFLNETVTIVKTTIIDGDSSKKDSVVVELFDPSKPKFDDSLSNVLSIEVGSTTYTATGIETTGTKGKIKGKKLLSFYANGDAERIHATTDLKYILMD